MADHIKYLERNEIDIVKWDALIDRCANGLIYNKSYYLDSMSQNWSGIILNDYEAVLPLTYKQKFKIKYVCMPPFVQQLGIITPIQLSKEITDQMVSLAYQKFKFGEYNFNYNNEQEKFSNKNNYIINLKEGYSALKKNYKTDLNNNLTKAYNNNLIYSITNQIDKGITLFQQLYKERMNITYNDYKNFALLCKKLSTKNELIIRQVSNQTNDELSTAICLKDGKRIYFVLSATTKAGRKLKANHYLIDQLIKEFSGQNLLLDFEGSDINGIAHFYKNFGSINHPYYFHRWNHLPWPLSVIKDRF
jgi:hypothetical protein